MRADVAPFSVSVNLTPRESEAALTSVQAFRRLVEILGEGDADPILTVVETKLRRAVEGCWL
jgi:hypothetical protein